MFREVLTSLGVEKYIYMMFSSSIYAFLQCVCGLSFSKIYARGGPSVSRWTPLLVICDCFIVYTWRLTRILERGPIPRNVIVLSRSSSPDPEQYDGNRHIRM